MSIPVYLQGLIVFCLSIIVQHNVVIWYHVASEENTVIVEVEVVGVRELPGMFSRYYPNTRALLKY
jgi:hypothetical protein